MASIDAQINRIVREKSRRELEKGMNAIAKVGRRRVLQKRENVTISWFGSFNSDSMIMAIDFEVEKIKKGYTLGSVNLATFIDIDQYKEKLKAEDWRETYGGDIEAKEYVLNLQLYEGIIGLPEKATFRSDSNWKNEHFHKQEPLIKILEKEITNNTAFLNSIIIEAGLSTTKER